MKKLLAVDGNSIINRAFYGIRPLSTSDGLPTNAIYGTVSILAKHLEALKPDFALLLATSPDSDMRFLINKAGRRPMPNELAAQFDIAKECAGILGLYC